MARRVYVGVVEGDQRTGYSMFFPDVDGCVTAADTMDELAHRAREVLDFHFEGMIELGLPISTPRTAEEIPHDPEVTEAGRMFVDVEVADDPVRVNVSLPSSLLTRIDRAAERRGLTRSSFLAEGAKTLLKAG